MLLLFTDEPNVHPGPIWVNVVVNGVLGTYPPSGVNITPATVYVGVAIPGPSQNPHQPYDPADPDLGPILIVRIDGVVPEGAWDKKYQRQKSDTGMGGVTVNVDDPTSGATYGDLLTFVLNGAVKQTSIIEQRGEQVKVEGEEAAEVVTFGGRGLIAEWERMLVYPDIGAEIPSRLGPPTQIDRFFNWTASSSINDNSWPQAVPTDAHYGEDSSSLTPQRFTRPEGWPWYQSQWIWDRSSANAVPVGDVYFRRTFGLPAAGRYQVWAACDDEYELWLDGVKVLERQGFYTGQAEHVELDMADHFHQFAVRATNRVGRAGLQVALMPVKPNSTLGNAVVQSDAAWQVLGYPAQPPGATVGKVIRIVLDEAQVRGTLLGWTLGFTDNNDSHGRTWPLIPDYSLPVGLDGLSVLNQMAGSLIDYTFVPSRRRLMAYVVGTIGHVQGTPNPLIEITKAGEG